MNFAGKLALGSFLLGSSSIVLISCLSFLFGSFDFSNVYISFIYLFGHFVVVNSVVRLFFKEFEYQVAVRACALGSIFACGFFTAVYAQETYNIFGCYVCVLTFFHFSEFVAIAACNPETLAISSFVLNHSLDYKIAASVSWLEFFVESYFWPEMKTVRIIPTIGLMWCIGGEVIRKTAMLTASRSFTHIVVSKKVEHHVLVTNGIYSVFRHPSYVGWFYWSIGTQLILANPLCIIAYSLASWKFFNDRITIEEFTLLKFFGDDYVEYQKKVPIGLPFIKGYVVEE